MAHDPIETVRRAAPGDHLDLKLTAQDLQDLAQTYLERKSELDVRDLAITIEEPHVLIRGVTGLLGRDFRLEVRGTPTAREGRIAINLQSVTLNDAPAPKFAVQEIAGFLRQKFGSSKLLLTVDSVTVEEAAVRVAATRSPAPGASS